MQQFKVLVVGSIVLAAVGGFVGGTYYQKSQDALDRNGLGIGKQGNMQLLNVRGNIADRRAPNGQGGGGMMRGSNMLNGEVSSKDDKSMTVKMTDGSSRIVVLSSDNKYFMSSETSVDKVKVGTKVAVFGDSGTDGSLKAASVEIDPMLRGQQ